MSKKKLLSLSLVVIMIAILSLSSLAWFNDSDEVTNEFRIATSDDASDPDDIFSVDLWEPVDENNDGVIDEDEKEQVGLEFDNVLPGATYDKEPTVENTGAYDQYIRVVVTLTDGKAWLDALGSGYDLSTIFLGHDESKWTRDEGIYDPNNDELLYVYYLDNVLAPGATEVLFTDVQLPTSLTQEQMARMNGEFDLNIRVDAIQTENLGDGVDTAQEAFAAANWDYAYTEPQG